MSKKDSLSGTRCSAHSKRTGEQCGQFVNAGEKVCRWHGGSAPQVLEAARERLIRLLPDALERHEKIIGARRDADALSAIYGVYDRVGLSKSTKHELEGSVSLRLEELAKLADDRMEPAGAA